MRRAEFDWKLVHAALHAADLSDAMDERGWVNPHPHPAFPSERYRELHRELSSRLVSPPRKPDRAFGTTVAEVEKVADLLFDELARATASDLEIANRWEGAARWLVEAKRRARETRQEPSVFSS